MVLKFGEGEQMENKNIHVGLEDKDIRDFLGKEHQIAIMQGMGNAEYIKQEIEKLQKTLEMIKRRDALKAIIKDRGWNNWDVSDEVPYDPNTYFDFIGTEEEYETYKKKIVGEK